jgi:hypothetical protein
MNIANIFGLHLNCRVKVYNAIADLLAVNRQGVVEIFTNGDDSSSLARVENCKLILKPLSAITKKELIEIASSVNGYNVEARIGESLIVNLIGNKLFISSTVCGKIPESHLPSYIVEHLTMAELAIRGYDIGLVPDEYKEVEE